ncbi:hypothetical protein OAC89_01720 [Deltaproteobacteria bacterium]|nr:hypothetical protein [Deltaproteobacteria bacterium]
MGRSDCLSLKPSRDLKVIENEQKLVSEMKLLLKLKGFLPFEGLIDIGPVVEGCRVQGLHLEPKKILSVLGTAEAAEKAKKSILSQRHLCPGIYDLVKDINLCGELRESINKSIHPNGTIRDSASHALKKFRRKKTGLRRDLQKRLEGIKGSVDPASGDNDFLISIRDGRYVIPLRRDKKNRVQGIVHDYSRTQSTCFFEPIEVIDDNNRIAELNHLEKEEELRVLEALTSMIGDHTEDLLSSQTILSKLDGLYARARFSDILNGVRPVMCRDGNVDLRKALNPILVCMSSGGETIVPLDIILNRDVNVMIISGPNRGGEDRDLEDSGFVEPYGSVRPSHTGRGRKSIAGFQECSGGDRG